MVYVIGKQQENSRKNIYNNIIMRVSDYIAKFFEINDINKIFSITGGFSMFIGTLYIVLLRFNTDIYR